MTGGGPTGGNSSRLWGTMWYADSVLLAGINELDALALVVQTEGLPAVVLALLFGCVVSLVSP